jgi:hypothetical protein
MKMKGLVLANQHESYDHVVRSTRSEGFRKEESNEQPSDLHAVRYGRQHEDRDAG